VENRVLLIPGVFLGGIAGDSWRKRSSRKGCARFFAVILVLLGAWQALGAWWR